MRIGDQARSLAYASLGNGRIVNATEIGGNKYYDLFFEKTRETLTLEEKDIQKITTPLERLNKQEFDPAPLLKLRILAERIDSLLYQDKIITANNFKIYPLPHQVLAVNYVLEQFKPRCLIADEVGLGKTIEAALIFEELKLRNMAKRVLVVAPAGLTVQWKDELKTKFNEDFSIIDRNTSQALRDLHGNINIWKKYDKIITSLDFLKPKSIKDGLSERARKKREDHNQFITDACVNAHWDLAIFDESHKLSKDSEGSETSRYKLGKALSEATPMLLLLTATPHQGDSTKFQNLLGLIDEYKFYSPDSLTAENVKSVTIKNKKRAATDFNGQLIFKNRIASVVKIERDEEDIEVQLYSEVSKYIAEYYNLASREGNFAFMFLLILYQRMVSSSSRAIFQALSNRLFILKSMHAGAAKLKSQVEEGDVESLDGQELYEELTKGSEESIAAIESKIKEEIVILQKCVDLANKASHGRQDFKVRKTLEIMDEIKSREKNPKTKFLIFTEFVATQMYLGEILEDMGYKVAYLNGRMNLDMKVEAKTQFKETHQVLISTDAGGEGINLQFAHVIINYDLPWNPMKIEQRIGRLDRIGQKKDVLVFNYLLSDTVEDRVHEVLEEKLARIATQFGDDKKADVLNMLQDEFHFDKIYVDAIRYNQQRIPDLEKVGEEIFNRAKEILEKQDLLIPFSDKKDLKEIKGSIVASESEMVRKLVEAFLVSQGIDLKEYTKKKGVFYTDLPVYDDKLKNVVFDKDLALENEGYDFINITHPLVHNIIQTSMSKESLTFNIELKSPEFSSGIVFFYRLDVTNNDNYLRRRLLPLFVDESGMINRKASEYFQFKSNLEFGTGLSGSGTKIDPAAAMEKAEEELNRQVSAIFSEVKLELYERLEAEQQKFNQYFKDKENAIARIAIGNIRETKLRELQQHRVEEKMRLEKQKTLVPKIKLLAVARVTTR